MITPSFSLTATERVLPNLALDFTTASLDPRITFTRALNTATRVNGSGNIETVLANTPRFDFDPSTLVCKGLLIEESRVNYVSQSSNLGATWTLTGSSPQTDQIVSPDGTQNADKLVESATTGVHLAIWNTGTPAGNQTLTYSAYFKADTRTKARLVIIDGTTGVDYNQANFDLSTGSVISVTNVGLATGATASITPFNNGWYRCVLSGKPTTAANAVRGDIYLLNAAGVGSYTGDGTSGFYVWGAQMEIGAFPTSLIPTGGSALTRNADIATMTGTNFSDWYNQTAGTFMAQAIVPQLGRAGRIFTVDVGATTNMIDCTISAGNGCALESIVGGSYIGFVGSAGTISANTAFKVCTAYSDATTEAFSLNANTTGTNSLSFYTSMTTLRFGAQAGGAFINGALQKFNYYPQRLTNNEVQAFSKG